MTEPGRSQPYWTRSAPARARKRGTPSPQYNDCGFSRAIARSFEREVWPLGRVPGTVTRTLARIDVGRGGQTQHAARLLAETCRATEPRLLVRRHQSAGPQPHRRQQAARPPAGHGRVPARARRPPRWSAGHQRSTDRPSRGTSSDRRAPDRRPLTGEPAGAASGPELDSSAKAARVLSSTVTRGCVGQSILGRSRRHFALRRRTPCARACTQAGVTVRAPIMSRAAGSGRSRPAWPVPVRAGG